MDPLAFSMLNFLIWLAIPAYCIYLYLTKGLKGALMIATGFVVQVAVNLLVPVFTGSLIVSVWFTAIPLAGNVILAVFLIYGLHLLAGGEGSQVNRIKRSGGVVNKP